ncbi:flagellar motor protein MotS, partial [Bacillus altitudinis]
TKPVKDNKTNEHMKENRRVEIVIKKSKTTSS